MIRLRPIPALFWLTVSAGCTSAAEKARVAAAEYRAIVEKRDPEGLVVQEVDLNKDRQPDVFNVYRERQNTARLMVRKELDLNYDGRIDMVTHFTDEGRIEREMLDTDFDGKTDRIDHFQSNLRVLCEIDSNADGRSDVYTYFEGNPPRVTRKERDSNLDGQIDTWERYDDKGNVTTTGLDLDGDGKMDERAD